jgi:DNA mismatch endonuclease, patch repair protein
MTDTRTPEVRRRIMAAVRQRDTAPERQLRRALHAAGLRGWRCNYSKALGRPDVAWPGLRVAVFVDGAFWHGHPSRHRPGRSGAYWDNKIERNVARDREVDAKLSSAGWVVIRVWDFEVRRDLERVVVQISDALRDRVPTRSRSAWVQHLSRGPSHNAASRASG